MLTLIFTCKSYPISFTDKFFEYKTQLSLIFFVWLLYFNYLFKAWSVVRLIYFLLSLLTFFFSLFPRKITWFIYLNSDKPFSYDQSLRLETNMSIAYRLKNFVMHWLNSVLPQVSSLYLQFCSFWILVFCFN